MPDVGLPHLKNILSVDLEEWFDPEYVRCKAPQKREECIQESLKKTLDLLKEYKTKATCFVLGELAERHPELVEQIIESGHEVAFHGYNHEPLWNKTAELLKREIDAFGSLVSDECIGFRAPSFSLNNKTKWALKILEDAKYKYDSSVFPARSPLYGVPGAPTRPYKPSKEDISKEDESSNLWEFPPLVYALTGLRIPAAGGFYLRFLPTSIVKRAVKKMNKKGLPAVLFFHSWELDPNTPRLKIGFYRSFVTYHNLEEMERRLRSLLSEFEFTNFREYMEESDLFYQSAQKPA